MDLSQRVGWAEPNGEAQHVGGSARLVITGAHPRWASQTQPNLPRLEQRIRERLQTHGDTFPHQTGKPTANPTARWVFQYFVGIHLLILADGQALVLNLNEHHQSLLELLGQAYETFYS